MKAILISVGDELVLGQTVDTNSGWLGKQLAAIGCDVMEHITVADDQPQIDRAIRLSAARCRVILISGGLGPTADDLTRQAIASALGVELQLNAAWLDNMKQFFASRKRPMPGANAIQAMIPAGARIIWNNHGTAAGIDANVTDAAYPFPQPVTSPSGFTRGLSCRLFAVPGVPKEMKGMFADYILPILSQMAGGAVILSATLHTFSLGESAIAEMLGNLMDRGRNPSVGTTVSGGVVSLRINARYPSLPDAQAQITSTIGECKKRLGVVVYGQEDQSLASVVVEALLNPPARFGTGPLKVTTAESCTGGLLGKMLTDIPGSSGCYHQGWITYSNEAKTKLLGVAPALLAAQGAVSEAVVSAMAGAARELAGADFALAISGTAGPGGGTAEKPVGTVCISMATRNATKSWTQNFPGDREMVRDRSAKTALNILRMHLLH